MWLIDYKKKKTNIEWTVDTIILFMLFNPKVVQFKIAKIIVKEIGRPTCDICDN